VCVCLHARAHSATESINGFSGESCVGKTALLYHLRHPEVSTMEKRIKPSYLETMGVRISTWVPYEWLKPQVCNGNSLPTPRARGKGEREEGRRGGGREEGRKEGREGGREGSEGREEEREHRDRDRQRQRQRQGQKDDY
jgi:hypothetical protein